MDLGTGNTRRAAPLFAALGDRTRLKLVARLSAQGPLSTTRLGAGAHVTRQAIAKHLQVLAAAGLVRAVRRGREVIWHVQPAQLDRARAYLDDISRQWDHALEALKAFVER